jgi:hypothetical protein
MQVTFHRACKICLHPICPWNEPEKWPKNCPRKKEAEEKAKRERWEKMIPIMEECEKEKHIAMSAGTLSILMQSKGIDTNVFECVKLLKERGWFKPLNSKGNPHRFYLPPREAQA